MKNVTYINAGAGSGKTYTLTKELLGLIKSGVNPEKVILTTYTTKAAGEFREKAKAELYANGLFDAALRLDQALIGTVHSVCQRMIGKYWFNLGLSPDMSVMAEEDVKYYLSQSLAELPTDDELKFLHEFCRSFDIRETVDFKPLGLDYDFWQGHLKQIIEFTTSYEIADYGRSTEESLAFIRQFVDTACSVDVTDAEVDAMLSEARTYVNGSKRIKKKDDYFKKFNDVEHGRHERNVAWYMLVTKNLDVKYGPTCQMVIERIGGIWKSGDVYDLQEKYIRLMFGLAVRWRDNFASFKKEKNLLDFNDMEKYMRQLMQNRDIAADIAKSYNYLFVDEFQDSSPIQVKIFDALSDLMVHSYWVGDYKQAVYRFRGSDIELVKAVVDRISAGGEGCSTRTLDTSHRSLPDIVEVDNEVFTRTFADVLDYDNIHLNRHRENTEGENSLRYFCADGPEGVATHVAKLIAAGAKPNEIAVLARANATLANIAVALKEMQIASSREDQSVVGTKTELLVKSLLQVTNSTKDTYAKATVAFLTGKDFGTQRIIEEKLANDSDGGNAGTYLSEVPLIRHLLDIRPKLQQQSISSMVESLVIELNLYNVAKRFEEPSFAASCLQAITATARTYEEHSIQMNLPATIGGFIAYLEEVTPQAPGDANGVQLHTYHSCKGLQWRYVILTSLNAHPGNVKNAARYEMYGVHSDHSELPSADNPYPEVFIRLAPWIYGTAKNLPGEIEQTVTDSETFRHAYGAAVAEANRVLYVGMTRAKDVLLLNIEQPKKEGTLLQWFKDVGLDQAGTAADGPDGWDILCTGYKFTDFTITDSESESLPEFSDFDETDYMELPLDDVRAQATLPKYVSPSGNRKKGPVISSHNFKARIPFGKQPDDMAKVGDCIHQIFAGIEEIRPAYRIDMSEIIGSYGLKGVLIEQKSINGAWENLTGWLEEQFGPAVHTWHERPFMMYRDGQTVVGSIDFVWETREGLYLVDFKTCPMGADAVLDDSSEHYAGWYAGQLDDYAEALEKAGNKVLKRFIYYPVSGILAEIGNPAAGNED